MKQVFKFKYVMLMGLLAVINATMAETARLSCHTKENWEKSSENDIRVGSIIEFPGQNWYNESKAGNNIEYVKKANEKFDLKFSEVDGYWWLNHPEDEVFAEARTICREFGMPYPILFKEGRSSWLSDTNYKTFFKKVPVKENAPGE